MFTSASELASAMTSHAASSFDDFDTAFYPLAAGLNTGVTDPRLVAGSPRIQISGFDSIGQSNAGPLSRIDPTGHLIFTFAARGGETLFREKWSPGGVFVDAHGNVFAVDGLTIIKLSPTGQVLDRWR